ncbi:MAG: hypothetical protein IPL75_11675 [Acidobacteria bacterium]|nr:hypothetical protein [Acidobacteriota bacterium]
MALVARYHRQTAPRKSHEDFSALPAPRRRIVRLLAAMLRLAEGLDRGHAQSIGGIELTETPEGLLVRLRAGEASELELWAAQRHAEPLSDLLDRPIRFEVAVGRGRRRAARPPVRL